MTLKDKFVLVLNFFELLSCIAGFMYYQKLKNTNWRWFVFFLVFTFATEMAAKYFNYQFGKGSSTPIYRYANIPVTFLFFLWLFYKWFAGSKYQRIAVAAMVTYGLAWIVEEVFSKDKYLFGFFSYQVAVVFLLGLSVAYYRTLIKSQSDFHYQQDLMFWIITGILIFYLVNMPLSAVRDKLYKSNRPVFYAYWYSVNILNCLMYLFFIIGMKWGKPNSSYLSYSQLSHSSYS